MPSDLVQRGVLPERVTPVQEQGQYWLYLWYALSDEPAIRGPYPDEATVVRLAEFLRDLYEPEWSGDERQL